MANEIFTRIQLKYDSYSAFEAVKDTFKPLKGELCIVNPGTDLADAGSTNIPCLMKVGDGEHFWKDLPWVSATAADVYKWAKAADIVYEGQKLIFKDAAGIAVKEVDLSDFVNDEELTNILKDYYNKTEIDNLFDQAVNTVTTVTEGTGITVTDNGADGNHAYTIALKVDEAKEALGLGNYYTKEEASDKFVEPEEVIAEINKAIDNVANVDSITNITTLVEYANKNAGDLSALINEVYGAAEMTGESRIDKAIADSEQAKTDADAAVSTANSANTAAGEAKELATNAVTIAEEAKEAATGAVESAKSYAEAAEGYATTASNEADAANASAEAAATSEQNAATSAGTANTAASTATTAKDEAVSAKNSAVEAKEAAEAAKTAAATSETNANNSALAAEGSAGAAADSATQAGNAKDAAVEAQTAAETAQAAAEQAKADAEASNTSATAIANEAKATADAAKEASELATEAVNGLATIATTGDIYDITNEGAVKTSVGTDNTQKYIVLNCGSATTVI